MANITTTDIFDSELTEEEKKKQKEKYFGETEEELQPWIDPLAPSLDTTSEFGKITDESGDVITTDLTDDSWWLPDLWDFGSDVAGDAYDYVSDWASEKGLSGVAEEAYDVGGDLLKSQVNALAGSPEMLWNMAKLPYEGAKDFVKGDFPGMLMNIPEALHTRNPLKYTKEDPWNLYDFAEWPTGIWAAKKMQNYLQSKLPTSIGNIYKQLYPYWTSFADPAKKGIKQMTVPAIRGLAQYGLASTGIGTLLAGLAYAGTARPAGEGSDVVDQRPYGYVPGTRTWAPEGVDVRNPNEMRNAVVTGTSAPSNRAMMEMANTRRPGPRDDYRGL